MMNLKKECNTVFNRIEGAKKIEEIKNYSPTFLEKYFLNTTKYPQIDFKISKNELKKLGGESLSLSSQLLRKDLTCLEKLMLSMLWKNGGFGKEEHIIQGILNISELKEKSSGHVFYQFGKRLNNPNEEPIIDQHIIRAFVFQKRSPEEAVKIYSLEKKHVPTIEQYIKWARTLANRIEGEKEQILYEIDKLLFALGKYIKKSNYKLST